MKFAQNVQRISLLCAFLFMVSIEGFNPSGPQRAFLTRHQNHERQSVALTKPTRRAASLQAMSPHMEPAVLSPWESWCVIHMEKWYRKSLSIKCPFFRRRAADALDSLDMIMRFLVIRHKSIKLLGPPPAWRCQDMACKKAKGLSIEETAAIIKQDWREDTHKGYYITGKLNTTIYRDDCFFDGPDPDMPVKGLRKYLNAASQLFDQRHSRTELLAFDIQGDLIVAQWKMHGILMLPWRPVLPEWTGTTTYHRDEDGMIFKHEETWDLSVTQAFLQTFWPQMAKRIWGKHAKEEVEEEEGCIVS